MPIILDPQTDILVLIDIQPCFMPGGALAVPGGDEIIPVVNALLRDRFAHAVATQDWHPRDHSSFASNHPGHAAYDVLRLPYGDQTLWPDHAVRGSAEAALHKDLDQTRIELVIRKGFRTAIDSYSAFFENDRTTSTGLAAYLRDRGFTRLFLAGLATDFCVGYSAEDAARLGFTVFVIEDACRGIGFTTGTGESSVAVMKRRLLAQGVRFIETAVLAGGDRC